MNNEEIVKKLTEAIVISEKVSIWNDEHDKENPGPITGLDMIDNIIVDVIIAINPNWKRPN